MLPLFRNLLVLNGLLLLAAPLMSQTGTLSLSLSPKNAQVRINNQVLDPADGKTLDLAPGTYSIEVWAPFFKRQTEQVHIRSGETTRYTKGLIKKASEYAPYLEAKSEFATKKLKRTIPDLSLTAVYGVLGYVLLGRKMGEQQRLYDRGIAMQENHWVCPHPDAVLAYQSEYANVRADYEAARSSAKKRLAIGVPIMAVATGALAYHLFRRTKTRPERPVYQSANPFAAIDRFRARFRFASTADGMGLAMTF